MVVVLLNPAPNHVPLYTIGGGVVLNGTVSGPTLLDDYITVDVSDSFVPADVAQGRFVLGGATAWVVPLDLPIQDGSPTTAAGRHLNVFIQAIHAGGVVFDSVLYPAAFLYDPVGGLASLTARAAASNPTLALILAAVRRSYP